MSDVAIVYNGPSGAYHVRDSAGDWHELVRGVEFKVPDDLAASLLEVDGHDFEMAGRRRPAPKPPAPSAPEPTKPSPGSTPPAPTVKGD